MQVAHCDLFQPVQQRQALRRGSLLSLHALHASNIDWHLCISSSALMHQTAVVQAQGRKKAISEFSGFIQDEDAEVGTVHMINSS